MSDFNNGLSDAELERLALLAEEMGEVQQMIGKIIRHGYASRSPVYPEGDDNRAGLTKELGDVLVIMDFMLDNGDIGQEALDDRKRVKHHRIWDYLHHQHPKGSGFYYD